jgi:hypothetical protein
LGKHRVWAVDNVGKVVYGSWQPAGRTSYAYPAWGRRFVQAHYQISA